jgi:histidinol-phosphatase (PHP family)
MSIVCDYHIHTHLCKHATGSPEEYLEQAHKKGLKTIGFSDHCPVPIGFDSAFRMNISQFSKYVDMVNDLKDNSYGIDVLFGMEVDWVPGRMDELYAFLDSIDYDYLIGSVHYIDNKAFDNPDNTGIWDSDEKAEYIWNTNIDLMTDMVSSRKFDIVGHMDLPKKFGFYPDDMTRFMEKADMFFSGAAEFDVAIELNTAGLRKPVKEIYPSLDLLRIAKKHNVKITFGSDSHAPEEVGFYFTEAEELARCAGYSEYQCIGRNGSKKAVQF